MIKFSTRGEYGIRMMVEIARHHGRGPVSLTDVARQEDLPLPYLEQLVGRLRGARMLISHQGAHGGYELARNPQEITIGDVLRALEGPIAPMMCATEAHDDVECARHSVCTVSTVWERVRDAVAGALDSITLAELVPPKANISWLRSPDTIVVMPAPGSAEAHHHAARG
jgi:Rrf2 family transcriptional regulator, cysteine metabolism repressor